MSIPDLSFLESVHTGLDILEQMDFKPLRNKSVAILTNQTALNNDGKHLLDILKNVSDIKVPFIFSMQHGSWGLDDNRAKIIGRNNIEPMHNAQIIDLHNKYLYPPRWVMENIDYILIDFQQRIELA